MTPRLSIPMLASIAVATTLTFGVAASLARIAQPQPFDLAYGSPLFNQYVVREINTLRTDPNAYVRNTPAWRASIRQPPKFGDDWLPPFIPTNPNAIKLKPLTENPVLNQAAQQQAQYLGANGLLTHTGAGGTTPGQRLRALGWNAGVTAEDLSFGQATPAGVVQQLVVDAGVPGAPHRYDLLSQVYAYVGVACVRHALQRYVCVVVLSTTPMARPGQGADPVPTEPTFEGAPAPYTPREEDKDKDDEGKTPM